MMRGRQGFSIEAYEGIQNYQQLPGEVVDGVAQAIGSAFDGNIKPEDAREHMAGGQVLVARFSKEAHSSGVVAGFTSSTIATPKETFSNRELSDETGLYFAGAAIHKDAQRGGLYDEFNRRRLGYALGSGVRMLFTRTQNPRVEEGIEKLLQYAVIRKDLSSYRALDRVTCEGVYPGMLTGVKPQGRYVRYDDISYPRGDAFILSWAIEPNDSSNDMATKRP